MRIFFLKQKFRGLFPGERPYGQPDKKTGSLGKKILRPKTPKSGPRR